MRVFSKIWDTNKIGNFPIKLEQSKNYKQFNVEKSKKYFV